MSTFEGKTRSLRKSFTSCCSTRRPATQNPGLVAGLATSPTGFMTGCHEMSGPQKSLGKDVFCLGERAMVTGDTQRASMRKVVRLHMEGEVHQICLSNKKDFKRKMAVESVFNSQPFCSFPFLLSSASSLRNPWEPEPDDRYCDPG
jgi:hypothetical protein